MQAVAAVAVRRRWESRRREERRVLSRARGEGRTPRGRRGRREGHLRILRLEPVKVVAGRDGVPVDRDHAEVAGVGHGGEVAERDAAGPDVGHGRREDDLHLRPETRRLRDAAVLREVGRDVVPREVAVLGVVCARGGIAAVLAKRRRWGGRAGVVSRGKFSPSVRCEGATY